MHEHMIFAPGRGVRLVPRFSVDRAGRRIEADGVRYFTPQQAAAREGATVGEMIDWWNEYAAEILPDADVKSLLTDAASEPAIPPSAQERRHRQLRAVLYPDLNDEEFATFLGFCEERHLSPWCRHVWPEVREEGSRRVVNFITTIDAFRLIADRTREYLPGDTLYVDSMGETSRYWKGGPIVAALVSVRRRGEHCWSDANWESYAPMITVAGREVPAGMWATKPDVMISKVAEVRALRKAFPQELSGLYTSDEFARGRHEDLGRARPAPATQAIPDEPVSQETPVSFDRFRLEVIEMAGSKNAEELIAHFRAQLGGRYPVTSQQFFATVLAELRRHPAAYGVAEAVAA